MGLVGRPVRLCPACGKMVLAGKPFCWSEQCGAIFLFNGIGKDIISDDYIKDLMKRERDQRLLA